MNDDQNRDQRHGELIIGGVGLARYLDPVKDAAGYAAMPSLGWERAYRSGDLVVNDPDGLRFLGRADDQVKDGGRRIELGANVTCDFKSGKIILQQPVPREQMSKLLAEGKTALLENFVSNKTRRKFRAYLAWDAKEGKVGFEFEPRPVKTAGAKTAAAKRAAAKKAAREAS